MPSTSDAPSTPMFEAGELGPVSVAGNELRLITTSARQQSRFVTDIRAARRRVWLETYIFEDDSFGREIARWLMERARSGLDVRLLVDGVGSFTTAETLFDDLRTAGVRLHLFRPVSAGLDRWPFGRWLNRRDHRKLLIVDDDTGYFGGMNVVDTSLLDAGPIKPGVQAVVGWRDVHVRVSGPFARDLATAFERLWDKVVDKRPVSWPKWPAPPLPASPGQGDTIILYDSFPAIRFRRPERFLLPLLGSARQRLLISMAYFLPSSRLLRCMFQLRGRGSEVEVVVPGFSDVPAVGWATRSLYATLLKRGIGVHERSDRMLHSKLIVIDDDRVLVGSCNLDPRSLRHNLEISVVVRSREFTALASQVFHEDRAASRPVDLAEWKRRPWWQRALDWFAWRMRSWL
jgi:cardiolipin synthase A/B